jgi:hypothetical protein
VIAEMSDGVVKAFKSADYDRTGASSEPGSIKILTSMVRLGRLLFGKYVIETWATTI